MKARNYDTASQLKCKVKIFDTDKKELIFTCESLVDASKVTGLKSGHIASLIRNKCKNHTNKLGLILAFR